MVGNRCSMKTAGSILMGYAALSMALLCLYNVADAQQARKKGFSSAESPLRQTFNKMVEAARKKDDKALARFQAPNATYIDGSGFNRGFENYQAKATQRVGVNAPHAALADFKVADVTEKTVGNVGWVTYRYSLTAPVNGKETPIVGFATIIFQRMGNEWKVVQSQTAGRPRTESDKAL